METKASYTLVGLFTLLTFCAIIAFSVWSTTKDNSADTTRYSIIFRGSVAGLSVGNNVLFNGIKVGQVKQIKIDQNDPNLVRVVAEVDADTPIRVDSEAQMSIQGITGQATVAISGGTAGASRLQPKKDEEMATIEASRSRLDALIDEAPDLMGAAHKFLNNASGLVTGENKENLHKALSSFANVAEKWSESSVHLEQSMRNIEKSSAELGKLLNTLNKMVESDLTLTLKNLRVVAERTDKTMANLEPALNRMATSGLDDAQRLVVEARAMVRSIDALVQKIDSDPKRLLFGDNLPEYKIK